VVSALVVLAARELADLAADPVDRGPVVLDLADPALAAVASEVVAVSAAADPVDGAASDSAGREATGALAGAIRMDPEDKALSSAIAPTADVKEFTVWPS
jgi:hypothetical protein